MRQFVRTPECIYHLEPVILVAPKLEPSVAHHILILDRSGSMYYTIEELKQQVEHVLAVNAATAGDVLTTLISFSSQGDVTTHWARVPARDVITGGSSYVTALRKIRATALTCISQALMQGLGQVQPGETTGLTLFTDGYANHPSPSTENARFDTFVEKAKAFPGLFVNCIGYREWCDWPRMTAISSALHGQTVKAKSMLDVLAVMQNTQTLLASGSMSMVKVEAEVTALTTSLLAVNGTTGAVLSSGTGAGKVELVIPAADITDWSVYTVSELFGGVRPPKKARKADPSQFAVLALVKLQEGDMNAAKRLVFASGNKTIWENYQAAFTASRLADLAAELTRWVKGADDYAMGRNTEPKYSLFDLAEVINTVPERSLALDGTRFFAQYKRRSVKRVMGKRLPDGQIEKPNSELVTDGAPIYIRSADFNTSDASLQLGTIQSAHLVDVNGKTLANVAHVSLHNLASFRSYTLLSSGEFNVDELPLQVLSPKAWSMVKRFLIPSVAKKPFKAGMVVRINLQRFGLPSSAGEDEVNADSLKVWVNSLYTGLARQKILSALRVKGATGDYSPEQIAALAEVHLTPALYHSPPTTTPYMDKDQAVQHGEIDFYTRYKVYFGSLDVRNPTEFRSGNALLQAYFTGTLNGEVLKKPTFGDLWAGAKFEPKTRKGEPNKADQLMLDAAETYLGGKITPEEVEDAYALMSRQVDTAYVMLRGSVFEIGCRGMLPSGFASEMVMYSPEKFSETFSVKLKKAEEEATFYVAQNGLIISIVPESCEYSTDMKVAAN